MREVVIDEGAYRSADQVHAHLKSALSLPEYYGANLSALADCLEDIDQPTCIRTLDPAVPISAELADFYRRLRAVLERCAAHNPLLTVIVGEPREEPGTRGGLAQPAVVGVAQCQHPADGNVVALVERFAERARGRGADLLVFPENLMTPYELPAEEFCARAQTLEGPFCRAVDDVARRFGLWLIYTANEANPHGRPFNTAVVTDSSGRQRGSYRKVHLFDVGRYRESDKTAAGSGPFAPIATPAGMVGLGVCYDLRFPEPARTLALAGAQVLVFPSAWVDGPGKLRHWETLLAARAIENEVFTVGCCRCDRGYLGQSRIYGPTGECLAAGGDGEELLCAPLDLSQVEQARHAIPVLAHRRPDLYGNS